MSEASDESLRRGAAVMASGTAVSRVLGLLRGMVLTAAIGATGQAADAFAVANKLPNVLYMLLIGGVLNAVLVPQVVRAYKRNVGQEYVDRLLTFGFATLAAATIVLTVCAPLLVRLYSKPGNAAQLELATTFAYWCIPQMFFYGVYALLGQVLNARGSFGPYMWAPVVNNVVSIVGFGVFALVLGVAPENGMTDATAWGVAPTVLLAGSATVAVAAQALVLLPALRAAGVHYRPRWGLRGSGLGRAGTVATWTLVGLAIGQLGYIVVSRIASQAPEAAGLSEAAGPVAVAGNAAYDWAFVIFMLPHSLVTVSIATAMFTRMSAQAHEQDVDGVRASLSSGMRTVGVFTVLATAVVGLLAEPIVRLVMPAETDEAVRAVAVVVVAMIVGLPAFGAWSMSQRGYYAYEDARGMVPTQIVMAAVVVLGTLLGRAVLPPGEWVAGAGLAMSLSYLVGALMGMRYLSRRLHGADGARILRLHVRAAVAALPALVVGLGVLVGLEHVLSTGLLAALTECVVVSALMTVAYAVALRVLHVTELDDLVRPLLARVGRYRRR
ncbi:murein biosynthesis integral membrane protein MurJ [Cellulomonas composti]|uniref:Lipid II flippase MurJ n=1 Tax=Cellulomonas composti TaxID=266130 RepID=A0A511JDX5_9CELL|nr:murein biosynthesis integral membrane protein MurJ [Cellulomonas composti]GEL96146.1 lipid II flippase MurJ [Cellulomonas composti]